MSGWQRVPAREDPLRTATLQLTADPASAGVARRFLRGRLDQWEVTDGREDQVVLLASELVSNGVSHARSPMTLTLTLQPPGCLRIELRDDSPDALVVAPAPTYAEQGRGLAMVEALSDHWGVQQLATCGKVVWFELDAVTTSFAPH